MLFFHGSKRLIAYMKLIAAIASSLLPAPRSALTMLSKNAGAARQVFIQTANQWLNRALNIISPMIRCAFVWRQAVPPPPSSHSQSHPQAVLPSALCTPLCHLSMNLRGIGIPGHTTPEHTKRAAPRKILDKCAFTGKGARRRAGWKSVHGDDSAAVIYTRWSSE